MTDTANTQTTVDPAILGDLIRAQLDVGNQLLGIYLRSFTLYAVIVGALLKFAFDNNANVTLTGVLLSFAAALSAMGLVATVLGHRIRRRMMRDSAALYARLNVPPLDPEFLHIKYFNALVGAFMCFVLISCAYLWWNGITPPKASPRSLSEECCNPYLPVTSSRTQSSNKLPRGD